MHVSEAISRHEACTGFECWARRMLNRSGVGETIKFACSANEYLSLSASKSAISLKL